MKISRIAVLVHASLFSLVPFATAQVVVNVSPQMDIFKAGGYNDGSNGQSPAVYTFAPKSDRVLAFSAVFGAWDCNIGGSYYGPDGSQNLCGNFSIPGPVGTFSGIEQTDFVGALVGMFLEDSLPDFAPPTLRFFVSDYLLGGTPTGFRLIAPKIGQVFYIGDGKTHTGFGHFQLFAVPKTATHLYLGYADSCDSVPDGYPGCYTDNSGGVTAVFKLYDLH